MPSPTPRHERLEALTGTWKTQDWTRAQSGAPAARVDAVDTYSWLPGRFALLHRVDAHVGDQKVEGAEIIGYDPALGSYVTQYFGSDEPGAYTASLAEKEGALVWTKRSRTDRFTGTFSDDGNTITRDWERLDDDSNPQAWMDVTLIRQATERDAP
jgi:hypothetical protein